MRFFFAAVRRLNCPVMDSQWICNICRSLVSCLLPPVQESVGRDCSRAASSSLGSWICSLCNVHRTMNDLRREVNELKAHKSDLLNHVTLLEIPGNMLRTDIVSLWLDEVDKLDAAVADLENTRRTDIVLQRCCACLCLTCDLDSMQRQVKQLKEHKDRFGNLVCRRPPPPVLEIPAISDYTNSNLSLVDEILNHLREVDMVGIYGLGGIGKTELLKALNNHLYCMSSDARDGLPFWMVIYAHLTQDDICTTIQMRIRERLGLSDSDDLLEALSSERSMLLLLDNVWEALDWEAIGIPGPSPIMKVIFTTPSKELCNDMRVKSVGVRFLNNDESWKLFCQKMGEVVGSGSWDECSEYIKNLAKRVVISQCGGLPRAIINIAWTTGMNYNGPHHWKMIENLLKNSPHELAGMNEVLSPLKCSLDKLEKKRLPIMQCLLYCSLFSEGNNINTEQLIDYWIGEGYFNTSDHDLDIHILRQKGNRVIDVLQQNCLLEKSSWGEHEIRMHSVVRQMALWLTDDGHNRFITPTSVEEVHHNSVDKSWKNAVKISLMGIKEIELPNTISQHLNLVTLLLGDHNVDFQTDSRSKVFGDFEMLFMFLTHLRVPDLSRTDISCLPASISCLVHLNYLNISHTDISSLPLELKALTNLRQLILRNTPHLTDIPYKAICSLEELKTLNLCCSSYKWALEENGEQISVKKLVNFKLQELGIDVKVDEDLQALMKIPLKMSVTFLGLDEMSSLGKDTIQVAFSSMSNIRQLYISSCPALTELIFPYGVLPALQVLCLKGLPLSKITTEPETTNHFLPSLHNLQISQCHQLVDLSCIGKLPHLVAISVTSCNSLMELVATPMISDLLKLRKISLEDLPLFTRLSGHPIGLPNVEYIGVSKCQLLKSLSLQGSNLNILKEIKGEQTWWDQLQWNEDEKDVFLQCFKAM